MSYALKKGTTSKILLVYALDAADMRSGKTGLNSRTPDSRAAYIREGEAQVRRIPLVEGKLGEYRAGSFVEIDSKLLPGVYQFGVPDEMLAAGAETVTLMLKFSGAVIEPPWNVGARTGRATRCPPWRLPEADRERVGRSR